MAVAFAQDASLNTRVKICGITRVEDALCAASHGADAIGLVFYAKSPRHVSTERAQAIVRALPPFVSVVGLFVNAAAEQVSQVLAQIRIDLLQFHGNEQPDYCRSFGHGYLKAARVRPGMDLLQYAIGYQDASGLLLDTFVEGAHGGTGQVFDWSLIPEQLALPIVVSGGLNAANVGRVIAQINPWGVDVSSGVESSPGIKDAGKIASFIKSVRHGNV
ncbi:MAG: phosphoribosylanthranilate isomerase [Burkholderiales bacterium]